VSISIDPPQPDTHSLITITVQGADQGGPLTVNADPPSVDSVDGQILVGAQIVYGSGSLTLTPYTFNSTISPLPVGTYVISYYYIHPSAKSYTFGASKTFTVVYAPKAGLWWNPNESGTGYALDFKHGVMVATIYSFTADGPPTWYLAFGPIDSNNTVTAALSKYADGQCISCSYSAPSANGNDGTISIQFTSPASAVVTLPGRAPFMIYPQGF
jgi:hypothetical protein